jgi:hypothetical protein
VMGVRCVVVVLAVIGVQLRIQHSLVR